MRIFSRLLASKALSSSLMRSAEALAVFDDDVAGVEAKARSLLPATEDEVDGLCESPLEVETSIRVQNETP